jgi:hypothetical protein
MIPPTWIRDPHLAEFKPKKDPGDLWFALFLVVIVLAYITIAVLALTGVIP